MDPLMIAIEEAVAAGRGGVARATPAPPARPKRAGRWRTHPASNAREALWMGSLGLPARVIGLDATRRSSRMPIACTTRVCVTRVGDAVRWAW
jgi:hypothetical protein